MGRKGNSGKVRKLDPNSFQVRFGELVLKHREQNGLTQMDVARLVYGDETRSSQVSDVERGRSKPISDTISRYCAGLRIDHGQVDRLRKGSILNWPEIIAPGVALDRTVVGRDDDVGLLHDSLCAATAGAIVPGIVLRGQGGMGKTALAKFYIERYRCLYRGIWWIRGQTQQNIIDNLCDLAQVLEVPETGAGRKALARATLVRLQRETDSWLLVYDNVERHSALRELRPDSGNIKLLITSREGGWPTTPYSLQRTKRLPHDMAIELLLQECARVRDRDGAENLAKALDGLPLALVSAGAWLRDTPSASFDDYEKRLDEMVRKRPETLEDYPVSVYGSVMLSVEKLSADSLLLLEIFAFLAPDDLWPGLVTALKQYEGVTSDEVYAEAFECVPQELWALARDRIRIEHAFEELFRRSLIERQVGDGFGVHRLTQTVLRSVLGAIAGEEVQFSTVAVVAAAYPAHEHNPEHSDTWPICARLERHVDVLFVSAPDSPLLEIILKQAARYLDAQADYEKALGFAKRLLLSREKRLHEGHVEIGGALSDLAIQFWRLDRLDEAEPFAARAASMAIQNTDLPAKRRAIWLSIHSVILSYQGMRVHSDKQAEKYALSRKRDQYALSLDLKASGRNSRVIGLRLYNLAYTRGLQGNFAASVRLHAASLRVKRANIDIWDPELAFGLLGLGSALLEAGRVRRSYRGESALSLVSQSLEVRESAFSNTQRHPDRVKSALWLAVTHLTLQELSDSASGDINRAQALISEYELEMDELRVKAREFAHRARAYESAHPMSSLT